MAITDLDPTLLAAQDSSSRRPLVEIKVGQFNEDIPFIGQRISTSQYQESEPAVIALSDGRLFGAYIHQYMIDQSSYKNVMLFYTDTSRTEYNYVEMAMPYTTSIPQHVNLTELPDGNVGLLLLYKGSNTEIICPYKFTKDGVLIETGSAALTKSGDNSILSPIVCKTNSGYLMAELEALPINVNNSGAYNGTTQDTYYLEITADGNAGSTAYYKWKKGVSGTWSEPIVCPTSLTVFAEGISVSFGSATNVYYAGQQFQFSVLPATPSTNSYYLSTNVPASGNTVTIQGTTYTWKSSLSLPTVANEVLIDPLSMDICMENLRCAIMQDSFEGTGEGVRYGVGTTAHPLVTATRDGARLTLVSIGTGKNMNNYQLSYVGIGNITSTNFFGGVDSSIDVVIGIPSTALYTLTSTDFMTWTNKVQPTLSGLTASRGKQNVALTKLTDGSILMWFDYLDSGYSVNSAVYNLYYSKSTDDGVTWSAPTKVTSYALPSAIAQHPSVIQRTATDITVIFDQVVSSLHMTNTTPGWDTTNDMYITAMHYDASGKYLYCLAQNTGAGTKVLYGIIKVNVDTWTIVGFWNGNTVPGFSPVFTNYSDIFLPPPTHISGNGNLFVVLGIIQGEPGVMAVLDGEANTITNIVLADIPAFNLTKNVDGYMPQDYFGNYAMAEIATITEDKKLWFAATYGFGSNAIIEIGSIDISDLSLSTFKYEQFILEANTIDAYAAMSTEYGPVTLYVDAANDIVILSTGSEFETEDTSYNGFCFVYSYSQKAILKRYTKANYPLMPLNGIGKLVYIDGKIYGSTPYRSGSNDGDKMGLICIDLASDYITYNQPPFCPNGYSRLTDIIKTNSGTLIMFSTNYGIALFDTVNGTWTLYNNDSISGLLPTVNTGWRGALAYNEEQSMVYFGSMSSWPGIAAFSIYGRLEQSYYMSGTYTTDWSFGTAYPLVKGISDSRAVCIPEPVTNALYAFWNSTKGSDIFVKWDKETGLYDLTGEIIRGTDIKLKRSIENKPSSLSFEICRGHLYDPHNVTSLLSRYIKKGKKVTLRWGEKVNGVDYWQPGNAVFAVDKLSLSYNRGEYPSMKIECEDQTTLWEHMKIVSTPYYDTSQPDYAMKDFLEKYGGLTAAQLDSIGTFENGVALKHQFVDQTVKEAVQDIMDRFGHFYYMSQTTNKLSIAKINLTKNIDHTYSGDTWLINYTPDDSFSDYTNKVSVTGESATQVQVLYAEESVLSDSGTVGWWNGKTTKRLWYSEDHSKRVANPRLDATASVNNIAFQLAGKAKEYISAQDTVNLQWVEVTIDTPNLIPVLLGAIALISLAKGAPPTAMGGQPKWAAVMEAIGINLAISVLGAVVNYQHEIYGTPIGYVRQSFEQSATDSEMVSTLNGTIVEKRIDDPLCYTVQQCQEVANFELSIVKAQRNRIKLEKLTHLQDEPGDIIQFNHPFSHLPNKLLVTDLTRTMTIPESDGKDGGFTDELEGWKLE